VGTVAYRQRLALPTPEAPAGKPDVLIIASPEQAGALPLVEEVVER
jgi:hypothetical protein